MQAQFKRFQNLLDAMRQNFLQQEQWLDLEKAELSRFPL